MLSKNKNLTLSSLKVEPKNLTAKLAFVTVVLLTVILGGAQLHKAIATKNAFAADDLLSDGSDGAIEDSGKVDPETPDGLAGSSESGDDKDKEDDDEGKESEGEGEDEEEVDGEEGDGEEGEGEEEEGEEGEGGGEDDEDDEESEEGEEGEEEGEGDEEGEEEGEGEGEEEDEEEDDEEEDDDSIVPDVPNTSGGSITPNTGFFTSDSDGANASSVLLPIIAVSTVLLAVVLLSHKFKKSHLKGEIEIL